MMTTQELDTVIIVTCADALEKEYIGTDPVGFTVQLINNAQHYISDAPSSQDAVPGWSHRVMACANLEAARRIIQRELRETPHP